MIDFLIQPAIAQSGDPGGSAMLTLMFPVLILVLFYFLFIRPQQKRIKEHRQMVGELKPGDEIVTNGGVAGRITEIGESFVTVNIAKGVDVQVQKQAVGSLLPKGTLNA